MKFVLAIAFVIACIGVEVWAATIVDARIQAAKEKCREVEGVITDQRKNGGPNDENATKVLQCISVELAPQSVNGNVNGIAQEQHWTGVERVTRSLHVKRRSILFLETLLVVTVSAIGSAIVNAL